MNWLLSALMTMSSWCERHLISDDPYQYEKLTIDQLAKEYAAHPSKPLAHEIEHRLNGVLARDDREILMKLLNDRGRK